MASENDIVKLEELFQELFTNLVENPSLSTVSLQFNDICQSLIAKEGYQHSMVFDIILKNYIKLLDFDRFVEAIIHHDPIKNNIFLREYFSMISHCNIRTTSSMRTSRETFFFFFDQLNSSRRILSYLQNDLPDDNQILINICRFLLYTILTILVNRDLMLTNNDLVKYQNNLFNQFIRFLDRYFIGKESSREKNILVEQMLVFICNISHNTSSIPILINADCPQACLRWLALSYLDTSEYEFILYTLYNIARHDDGVILLRNSNCPKIVREFQVRELNKKIDYIIYRELSSKICGVANLILALVIDPDELYLEKDQNGTIKQVLSLCKIVFEQRSHPYKEYNISELLILLMKLSANDHIIDYILDYDQYPKILITTLRKLSSDTEKEFYRFYESDGDFNGLAITAFANIFWSISFNDRYKTYLIQNIDLINRLEEFREHSLMNNMALYTHLPYQMSSLRRAIEGIWQNLYPSKSEIKSISRNKKICSIMISYSPVNIQFCREFYDVLSTLPELMISVDFKNGKYSWKEIAETIEESNVILFLLSKEFYYTKTCRQEFIYVTDTLKKLFFPIFIDSNFQPSGWLHQRIARLKSIRFGEKDSFLSTCEELLSLINENLSMNISLIKNSSNVTKWNDEEIKQWFINHRIIPELYEFYHFRNGHELLLYATATLAFPWIKEYERIKLRFEEKFKQQEQTLLQDQFLQFAYALKQLSK